MAPNAGSVTPKSGGPNWVLLKALKNSARNWKDRLSSIAKFLNSERSTLASPGVRGPGDVEQLPNVYGAGSANTEVSNHRFTVGVRPPLGVPMQFARHSPRVR